MRRIGRLTTWVLGAWFALVPALEAQQTGTVQGRVVTEGGQALAGAQISVGGTDLGGLTNRSGRYLILNVPVGEHTIQVQSMGYATATATVTVQSGEVTTQDFRLGEEAVALDALEVTVGSRAAHTAADELPVPVDVYTEAKLVEQNNFDFLSTIQQIAPSVYVPQEQISDLTSGLRPFQLRGMSPDQALVLINGKRRHKTASVAVFGNSAPGSSGVDMNAIPQLAIGGLEVLRDGASAQYGSDAIAGVMNVRLKNTVSPLTFEANTSKFFPDDFDNDGWRGRVGVNWGFEVPGIGGVLNVTGEYQRRNPTERAGADPRPQLICGDQPEDIRPDSCDNEVPGDADAIGVVDGSGVQKVTQKNNPIQQPNHLVGDGRFENELFFWNYERAFAEIDEEVYFFGGVSTRTDLHTGFFRRSNDDRNWPQIHPTGFLPTFDVDTRDLQLTGGVRGEFMDWSYDVGGSFGENKIETDITNTLNASLGPSISEPVAPGIDGNGTCSDGLPCPANSAKFFAGEIQNQEITGTIDVSRPFEVGLPSPLTVAAGFQIRGENYQLKRGERGSFVNGFHPTQFGRVAASGSQVFPGFRPEDEADDWRTNVAGYLELETNVHEDVLLNAAGRVENYSDFGARVTGKGAVRYQPVQDFIMRASVSTGFRAPNLSQVNWQHISTGFQTTETGDQVAFEIGEFRPGSPEARALGAQDLEEETSVNLAGGIAITPIDNLTITADGYYIDVDDAIVLSGTIQGDEVEEILAEFDATAIKFFTNAIDFTVKGFDLTANYRWLLGQEQLIEIDGAFNFGRINVDESQQIPPILQRLDERFLSRAEQLEFEREKPSNQFVGTATYRVYDANLRFQGQFFGDAKSLINTNPDVIQRTSSQFLLNASLGYNLPNGLSVTVGADNITDEFPDLTQEGFNFLGIFPFSTRTIPINGRRLYAQFRYTVE